MEKTRYFQEKGFVNPLLRLVDGALYKKALQPVGNKALIMVGVTGFEPTTPTSRT